MNKTAMLILVVTASITAIGSYNIAAHVEDDTPVCIKEGNNLTTCTTDNMVCYLDSMSITCDIAPDMPAIDTTGRVRQLMRGRK